MEFPIYPINCRPTRTSRPMKTLFSRIWRSPRLSRILLALSMPTMVTIGFAPGWAIALCIGTLLLSVIFMYAEVLSPKFVQKGSAITRQLEGERIAKAEPALMTDKNSAIEKSAEATSKIEVAEQSPALLKAWADYGFEAVTALSQSQNDIREAIRMSTSSAIEVGHCVQQVQSNHDSQVLLARQLLEATQSGPDQGRSLADLAALAAEALDHQSKQMALTAENAFYLVERQQMASLIALRVDDLLADADKAAKELAMAALSSEDRANDPSNSPKIDPLAFSKTYRNTIRELRTGLDAIRQSLAQATNDLQNNVNQLKGAANLGRAEVDSVARSIQTKLSETQQTMKRLNTLSADTDNHIRNAVVAMQYHDITTQKLASVESNKLQSLLAHTQTMVANSHRQFPQLTTKPAIVAIKTESIPSKPSPIELMQTPPSADQFDAETALKLMQEAELAEATESDQITVHDAPRRLSHNELSDAALAELAKHSDDGPRLTLHPEERANLVNSRSNITGNLSVNHL
jgi:methyl-accepting chemotaxis protein